RSGPEHGNPNGGLYSRAPVTHAPAPAPGTRLGPYEITSKLGEGGMGEVWRATDTRLERQVAIKVLPAAFTQDKERLARFEREAKLLAQLNHPNIAQIYGLETSGETRALVMELVDGPTLAERLEAGPLPVEESLGLALQIAQALEEAHEKGIVHRDLKPQNIKASSEGKIKVLDFGLAKAMEPTGAEAARSPVLMNSPTLTAAGTQLGTILGTAAYMAPEQAKGALVDKRADIWAFGAVLFEMLSGRRLFAGDSVPETLAEVLKAEIDLAMLPASTPGRVRELLSRCLERNPKNRLRDIGDARLAIAAAMRGGVDAEVAIAASSREVKGSGRLAWIAAGICALVAGLAGVMAWRSATAPPDLPRFTKLTFAPQFISNARFAPDGRTVVVSAAREGAISELFLRGPEDRQPRPVGKPGVQLLAVSSRGELALLAGARYKTHRTYRGTLARMALAEEAPREVLKDVTAAAWSPDGAELAIVRQVEGRSRLEYPVGKVLAESTSYVSDIRISPSGDFIAYMPHEFSNDNRGRVVVADRSGNVVAKSPEYWGEEGLAWSADGEKVLYSASGEGSDAAILELALDGSVRTVLAAPVATILHDVSADGRLLVSTELRRTSITARFAGAASERDIPWLGASSSPILSRDGRSLLFGDFSELSGHLYAVMFQPADGSPPVRLGDGVPADLSPDASSVLAVVMDDPPRLMIYPTGAGEPRDISGAGFVAYDFANFVRDGKSVCYFGNPAGKASRGYLLALESPDGSEPATARAITPEGTIHGRCSPDATSVIALAADGRFRRYRIGGPAASGDAETSEGVPVTALDAGDEVFAWRADGRSILVYRPAEISGRVDVLDVETGQRTLLRDLAPADRAGLLNFEGASFSADETAYAYGVTRSLDTLYMVEGVR
ncbi:MAG: eukaryotic-like serine/threonine-protein kinase, partial [Acidobacteriota bacterium]|nr:eukaryotic-like serine/threonine-protein kinase [Acidobacteriota bacterium]